MEKVEEKWYIPKCEHRNNYIEKRVTSSKIDRHDERSKIENNNRLIFSQREDALFRSKTSMFRGITTRQRLERNRWWGDEREGARKKRRNWRESSVSRVLLVKRDSLKSLSTVVYFLAIPRPSRTIVRSTPFEPFVHPQKREDKGMEENGGGTS